METRSSKTRKLRNPNYSPENYTGDDRITHLPDAILHHILLLLPIKSIVQTSIISKRWRTLWYTFPDLDFTTIIPPATPLTKILHFNNFRNGDVITRILSLRNNLSDVRSLRFIACMSFSGLQILIRHAVRLSVQELDIRVETSDTFNFPRSIITHECLRVLKMKACPNFRLPPSRIMRSGFQTLQTLSLSYVYLGNQSSNLADMFTDCSFPQLKKLHMKSCYNLNYLRVGCRLLEELELKKCFSLQGLEILSPRLVTLKVSSCFNASNIYKTWVQIDTPRLHSLIWVNNSITSNNCVQNLVYLHDATVGLLVTQQDLDAEGLLSVSSFVSGLSHAVSLTLDPTFIEIMSKNNPLVAIFFNLFTKLNSLELQTSEVLCLAGVLKVCPFIHTLIIKITNSYKRERRRNRLSWDLSRSWEEKYWESQIKDLGPLLHHLKIAKIHGFSEYDISVVKFLLQHGKVLQEFILYLGDDCSRGYRQPEKLKSRIMGFTRASVDVKLAFH
ncbi:hypothetical protein R6Q59_004673 [Mikania micrantha]